MLTICPVNNLEYYSNLAEEDYYLGSGEPPGTWYGLGARHLNIHNDIVDSKTYQNLMMGGAPDGAPLVQNSFDEKRRKAWDLTYSAPKSVSLLWARADDSLRAEIQEAHKQAVRRGIDFIERNAALTRRGKAGETLERSAGLVVATFDHCTSRDQDFQLHTHALVCNLAPRADETWGSIESRKLYQWHKAAGAMYRAELASQMKTLGFQIEADKESFHVVGVDKGLCRYYSKRTQAIEEELEKKGLTTSASKSGQAVKLSTRAHKKPINHKELLEGWQTELTSLGCDQELISSIQSKDPVNRKRYLETAPIIESITDKKAIFKPQDVFYKVAVESVTCGLNANDCEQLTRQSLTTNRIVELQAESAYSPLYTTEKVLKTEESMLKIAKSMSKQSSKRLDENQIDSAIYKAERELGFSFDDEQLEAAHMALNGPDISILQGSAGAGKTTLMLAAKHGYEAQNLNVLGASIAKKAADNLEQETGIASVTIASLISKIEKGGNPLTSSDVLVVDEAGQLPSNYLQQIMYCADQAKCKLILSGEDKQLDAINRGGSLRYLSSPEVIGTQRIENIRRQRSSWAREVVADFRDGKAESALKVLEQKNCLHYSNDKEATKANLVKQWHDYQKSHPHKESLVIAHRWDDVKELSNAIRDIHISEGRVGRENISLACSVADKRFNTELSKGDRIKFCRNDYKSLGVSNGTLGTIESIRSLKDKDTEFSIKVDDGRKVNFLASDYADEKGTHLCLAYALTVYSSQGTTIDGNTFVYYTKGMDRANTYVAASRHKDESHIFCNRHEIEECIPDSSRDMSKLAQKREEMLVSMMTKDNLASLATEKLVVESIEL